MHVHLIGPKPAEGLEQKLNQISSEKPSSSQLLFIDAGIQHIRSISRYLNSHKNLSVTWIGDHDGLNTGEARLAQENFESLMGQYPHLRPQKICFNPDKDSSDFALALDHVAKTTQVGETKVDKNGENDGGSKANPQTQLKIFCHGLIGGQLDHQLAILGELNKFIKDCTNRIQVYFVDQKGNFMGSAAAGEYESEHEGKVSIFSLEQQTITISGAVKYAGDVKLEPFSSQGLSNEATGLFKVSSHYPIFIFWNQNKD